MHDSVKLWVMQLANRLPLKGAALEVGSLDENGSVRPILVNHFDSYIGIDMREGRRVDRVLNANDLLKVWEPRSFDLVVSCEMLEHARDWKLALFGMKQLVADTGFLVITTRSPGFPRHAFPDDFHRFTPEVMAAAVKDMRISEVIPDPDPASPGVFALCYGPSTISEQHDDPSTFCFAEPAP